MGRASQGIPSSVIHRRPATKRAVTALVLLAVFLGVVKPPTATAANTTPTPPTDKPIAVGTKIDSSYVRAAKPAPIRPTDLAAGSGSFQAGAELRPKTEARSAPIRAQELASERTERGSVTANPDGTFTARTSADRLNYRDSAGAWQPIDMSLATDISAPYGLRVKANDRTVRFSTATADGAMAAASMGRYTLKLRAVGYGAGTKQGAELSFPGGPGQGSVFVQPTTTGFEWGVRLANASDAGVYAFAVDTGGLQASLDTDRRTVLLTDLAGDVSAGYPRSFVAGIIGAPGLADAAGVPARPQQTGVELVAPGGSLPAGVPAQALASLGASEMLVVYRIDPSWLKAADRQFPVTLDPSACIGTQASGCNINQTSGPFEWMVNQGGQSVSIFINANHYIRAGYDARGTSFTAMRSMLYFPDVTLPDGAQVTSASVHLQTAGAAGSVAGRATHMYAINKGWSNADSTNWATNSGGYNPAVVSAVTNVPTGVGVGTNMSWDVTGIARRLYTRRSADWLSDVGFMLRFDSEASGVGEVDFRLSSNGGTNAAPLFSVNYVVPQVQMNFDPALGAKYAPSAMVAGQTSKLPVTVTNTSSGFAFNVASSADYYRLGYRWFDEKGTVVASASQAITGGDIASGGVSTVQNLAVAAPPTPGQYVLRLDLVHSINTSDLWASDWAAPSKFYARNKRLLAPDSTRWTGASVVEREEFPVNVCDGTGTNLSQLQTVKLGDGGSLGINLKSHNLRYQGAGAVGFKDLIGVGVSYGFDNLRAAACDPNAYNGILQACGWWTNWDERLDPRLGAGNFAYQAANGNRYLVDTDSDGQLVSSASVLLSRPRVTAWDEVSSSDANADGSPDVPAILASGVSIPAYAGSYVLRTPSGTSTNLPGSPLVDLNSHRYVSFALRTSGAANAGFGFRIHNNSNSTVPDRWFVYTLGTNWATGFPQAALGGAPANAWAAVSRRDLYADLINDGSFGVAGDDLMVNGTSTSVPTGQSGDTFIDAVRFEALVSNALDETNPSWTSQGSLTSTSADHASGTLSVKVRSASLATSPTCATSNACVYAVSLVDAPFGVWFWKKSGGNSIALQFSVTDLRTGALRSLTYYAGALPPGTPATCGPTGTTPCAIQVNDHVPTEWTSVTRNVLEDARQVLGFFNDSPAGSNPNAPPSQGPTPDVLQLSQYVASAVDGNFALFDGFGMQSVPDIGSPEYGHPSTVGDATFTYDFVATYPDGSKHYFNRDGLLVLITDLDGNLVKLDWSYNPAQWGQVAYGLTKVRAPGDGQAVSGGTAQRDLAVAATTPSGFRQLTISEELGAAGSASGRRMDFWVATAASAPGADPQYAAGDLVYLSPARRSSAASCAVRPSGCLEASYTSTTGHLLWKVSDPRRDASNNDFYQVSYSGSDPVAVLDGSQPTPPALLQIVSFDSNPSGSFARPVWQDAEARAANAAVSADLAPDGAEMTEYVRKACTPACAYGSGAPAVTTSDVAQQHLFDGRSNVSAVLAYRCPASATAVGGCTGSTALVTETRQSTKAAAAVDNYNDPLAAAEVAWSQTADQYFASLADSAGANPDLYRTEYRYDDHHRVTDRASPRYVRQPSLPATILTNGSLAAEYRLGEASGTTLLDSTANARNGTFSGTVTHAVGGALVRDADTATDFDGLTGAASVAGSSLGSIATNFSVEAWAKPASTSATMTVFGTRGGSEYGADLKFMAGGNLRLDLGNGSGWLVNQSIAFPYSAGRWYFLALVVSGDAWSVYADGDLIGSGSGSSGARLTDTSHNLFIGQTGSASSREWFAGSIDEFNLFSAALTAAAIVQQAAAAKGSVWVDDQAAYDPEGHPIQTTNSAVSNGGFESGLSEYQVSGGASAYQATAAGDPSVTSGFGSLKVATNGDASQDVQLVPGQTARFQFAVKTDGGSSTHGSYTLSYWRTSSGSWVSLLNDFTTSAAWQTQAFDVSLPLDGNGRLRLRFWNDALAGSAYFDDAIVVTTWGKATFAANGLLIDRCGLRPGAGTAGATVCTRSGYAASAANPAIFPTAVTDNYVDGTFDPAAPDTDVTAANSYDAWGRL